MPLTCVYTLLSGIVCYMCLEKWRPCADLKCKQIFGKISTECKYKNIAYVMFVEYLKVFHKQISLNVTLES